MADPQEKTNGSNGVHHDEAGQHEEGFGQDLAMLRDEITKLTESVSEMLKDQAGVAQDRLRGAANETYATMNEAAAVFQRAGTGIYDDAGKRLDTLASELTDTIRKAPLASLGIAAGLGFLYGLIRR